MPATVEQLYRYPIKSMTGESRDSLHIGEHGATGDRVWAVRDEKRGGIRGAKKIPALMTLAARFAGEVSGEGSSDAVISAPDGTHRSTSDPDVNDWLSEKLAHPVTLWPLLPADALEHYRRGAPDHEDFETELRDIFGRTQDEPLPDLTLFAEVIEYESPPGTYFDAFPLLLMSRQSLQTMQAHRAESRFDVRRFRPNILLDITGSDDGYPEQAWVGRRLRVGEAELEVVGECPRCSMTTHGFDDLQKDPGIMRSLVQANGGNLGVYARVVNGGTIDIGASAQAL